MRHTILVDGRTREIDIRVMDEAFIVYRKLYRPPLTPANIGSINPGDWAEHLERFQREGWQQRIEAFFRQQIRRIGSCGVLAWDGDGVIGKMYFTTKEVFHRFQGDGYPSVGQYCVEHDSMPRIIQLIEEDELQRLLASPSKTLRIVCFNVGHTETRYQGQGIASQMLALLKAWARSRGWRRLEALAYPDVVPYGAWAPHILRRGALERRGFTVVEERMLPAGVRAQQRAALARYLTETGRCHHTWGYDEAVHRSYDAATMHAYHREYRMAFDL